MLSPEQCEAAHRSEYNFDHPDAFDFELLGETLRSLKAFRRTEVPQYDFSTHSRLKDWKTYYGANVILFEGWLHLNYNRVMCPGLKRVRMLSDLVRNLVIK